MKKVRGTDARLIKKLKATLLSISARDATLESSNPRGKVVFFPSSNAELVAAINLVNARIVAILAMEVG